REGKRYDRLFPCLQKDYQSLWRFLHPDLLKAIPHLGLPNSLIEILAKYFKQEKLQLCFTFQAKYLGMSPWDCPGLFSIIPFSEYKYGIYHVMGGLNKISEGMAKVIEEEGGKIHLSTNVKRLIIEGKEVKGVELDSGEKVYADDVVVNADFGYAMTGLAENKIKKYTDEKLKQKLFSCSTFMLYLGLKKKYNIQHHNIIFADEYRRNVEDIFQRKILSDDFSFYLQNASITDPALAPEGKSALYVLVPVPYNKSGIDWNREKSIFREKILKAIETRSELKDIRSQIEVEKVISPMEWEKDYNVYLGATFNLGHNIPQMLYWRPRNKFEKLQHCYLVGGGTHPGSGLPTIYESARISSNLLCKHYGIKFQKPSQLDYKEPIRQKK
ncbi:MAG: phytoene desaturase family protein, partial [bacterium]|nr:phytoene desaturase family protein [bacterium]